MGILLNVLSVYEFLVQDISRFLLPVSRRVRRMSDSFRQQGKRVSG